jgi:hypothetical protein
MMENRAYEISVGKTIQEKQYEPFNVSLKTSFSVPKEMNPEQIKELLEDEYDELENRLEEIIEYRLENK